VKALRGHGTGIELATVEITGRHAHVIACDDPDAELRTAGAWSRRQLEEDPDRRIGIVVSSLEQDAERAGRLVREGLVPGWQYAQGTRRTAVNVSFGRRLRDYPAIEIALLLLRWTHSAISGKDLSLLMRTPFLGAGDIDARARLELELRRIPDRNWTPQLLRRTFSGRKIPDGAAEWLTQVGKLGDIRREQPGEVSPAHWAEVIDALLESFRWPGDTVLESKDFQLINRWRDLLNDFARLELVVPRMALGHAVGQLSAMASETIFQPEMEGAVVQVLGPLEAASWLLG